MTARRMKIDYEQIRAWVYADNGVKLAAKAAAVDLDTLDADEIEWRIYVLRHAASLLRWWGEHKHELVLEEQASRFQGALRARSRFPCRCGLADQDQCQRKMVKQKAASGWTVFPHCERSGWRGSMVKRPDSWHDLPELKAAAGLRKCCACYEVGPIELHHVAPRERFGDVEAEQWPVVPVCRLCHMHWHEWEHGHEAQAFPAHEAEGGLCEICNDFAKVVHRPWFEGIGKAGSFVRSWVCRKCWDGYEAKMHGYVWRSRGLAGGGR